MNSNRTFSSYAQLKTLYTERRGSMPEVLQQTHMLQRTVTNGFNTHNSLAGVYDGDEYVLKPKYQPTISIGNETFNVTQRSEFKNIPALDKPVPNKQTSIQVRKDIPDKEIEIKSFEVVVRGIKPLQYSDLKQKFNDQLSQQETKQEEKQEVIPQRIQVQEQNSQRKEPEDSKAEVTDIFQLMEHNQILAKRMQDLQRIIADQKQNIDQLPNVKQRNQSSYNHKHSRGSVVEKQFKKVAAGNKQEQRAKSKLEVLANSKYLTSRNHFQKKRNQQMVNDYQNHSIDVEKEETMRELVKQKKKKVHRMSNSIHAIKSNKDTSQKALNVSPLRNRFLESKLLTLQGGQISSLYKPRNHPKKCSPLQANLSQDKDLTWQEKTYHNLAKLTLLSTLQTQPKELKVQLNSSNFKFSDLQLVKLL